MELDERAATDPFDRRDTACGWAAVWMGRTIQQLRQRLASANRRIVFILPKHRDAFGASLGEFVIRKHRRTGNLHDQIEDGVEILRKAHAGEGHRVASRANAQGDAAFVELLGNGVRVPAFCAAIDNAGGQRGHAGQILRVVEAPRQKRRVHRYGGRRGGLLNDDRGPVRERLTHRR